MSGQRILFPWILSPQKDLLFYIGSALAGWLYVAIIVYAIFTLESPLKDALAMVRLGEFQIPLTLQLLVVLSWGTHPRRPHVWATLARTLFDPDEWKVRKHEIWVSFVWFFFGPVAILLPYASRQPYRATRICFANGGLSFGALAYFVFFRLWAYYHVVRQHWGFFSLYKRKASDHGSACEPGGLVVLQPQPVHASRHVHDQPVLSEDTWLHGHWPDDTDHWRVECGNAVYPAAWALYLAVILFYLGFQIKLCVRRIAIERQQAALHGADCAAASGGL